MFFLNTSAGATALFPQAHARPGAVARISTRLRLAAALGLGELCLHVLQLERHLVTLFAQLLVLGLQLVHIHARGRAQRHLDETARAWRHGEIVCNRLKRAAR